jgi:RNA polymerase sigma-70 factor (ECF subfamily)
MAVEEAPKDPALESASAAELDWNAVYAAQLPRVYNYLRFRLGRHSDIEELTSRTFEKAWKARSQYRRDMAGFSAWLFGIARNVAADDLRSRRASIDRMGRAESAGASRGCCAERSLR